MKNKTAFLFWILLFLYSCNNNNKSEKSTPNIIDIKNTVIKAKTIKHKNLEIDELSYPQIDGLNDSNFQLKVNNILVSNVNNYIESIKESQSSFEDGEIKAVVSNQYEILTKNENLISIVQFFFVEGLHGGNNHFSENKVLNIDVKNNKIIENKDFKMEAKLPLINKMQKQYFSQLFKDESIEDEILADNGEVLKFKDFNFAVRNDSIMLVVVSMPGAGYTSGSYVIPIDKKH